MEFGGVQAASLRDLEKCLKGDARFRRHSRNSSLQSPKGTKAVEKFGCRLQTIFWFTDKKGVRDEFNAGKRRALRYLCKSLPQYPGFTSRLNVSGEKQAPGAGRREGPGGSKVCQLRCCTTAKEFSAFGRTRVRQGNGSNSSIVARPRIPCGLHYRERRAVIQAAPLLERIKGVLVFHHMSRIKMASSCDKCIAEDCLESATSGIGENPETKAFLAVTWRGLYFKFLSEASVALSSRPPRRNVAGNN